MIIKVVEEDVREDNGEKKHDREKVRDLGMEIETAHLILARIRSCFYFSIFIFFFYFLFIYLIN